MRLLGVDYGEVRTGIAICDPSGFLATGLMTLTNFRSLEELAEHIVAIAKENKAVGVILGLPLNMDDSEGEKCVIVRQLATIIEPSLPVTLWDERCTTLAAQEIFRESQSGRTGKKSKKKQKQNIDALAAQILLQDYLDNRSK